MWNKQWLSEYSSFMRSVWSSAVCCHLLLCYAQVDLCIEAFGTSKQKRALNSRRMNAVGNDILNTAVTKAAADVIDAKGVTGKNVVWDVDEGNQNYLLPVHSLPNMAGRRKVFSLTKKVGGWFNCWDGHVLRNLPIFIGKGGAFLSVWA